MAQRLRTNFALAEDLGSRLSTYTLCLLASANTFMNMVHVHPWRFTNTYTQNKINKCKKTTTEKQRAGEMDQ